MQELSCRNQLPAVNFGNTEKKEAIPRKAIVSARCKLERRQVCKKKRGSLAIKGLAVSYVMSNPPCRANPGAPFLRNPNKGNMGKGPVLAVNVPGHAQ